MLDLNGTRFISHGFDDFEAESKDDVPARFSLNSRYELIECRILCRIPITLLYNGGDLDTVLHVDLTLRDNTFPKPYSTYYIFSIIMDGKEIVTGKVHAFEGGLDILKRQLPDGYKFKCCFGCAYADYSVAGQGAFGSMLCFRNIKKEYLAVRDKDEYMDIMFDCEEKGVQETFLCDEFEVREDGTGYRG